MLIARCPNYRPKSNRFERKPHSRCNAALIFLGEEMVNLNFVIIVQCKSCGKFIRVTIKDKRAFLKTIEKSEIGKATELFALPENTLYINV